MAIVLNKTQETQHFILMPETEESIAVIEAPFEEDVQDKILLALKKYLSVERVEFKEHTKDHLKVKVIDYNSQAWERDFYLAKIKMY